MSGRQDETAVKQAVAEVYSNYASGLDSKNWPMVRDCFCDEVLIDYGPISAASGDPSVPRKADDWLQVLKGNLAGFDMTHHMIANHRYQFNDDAVSCTAYLVAEHMIFDDPAVPVASEGQFITVGGYYTNDCIFDRGQWRIASSMLVVTWLRGDPDLFEKAQQRSQQ